MPYFADHLLPSEIDLGDVNAVSSFGIVDPSFIGLLHVLFQNNYLEAAFKMIDRVILQGRLHMSVAILLLRRLWA